MRNLLTTLLTTAAIAMAIAFTVPQAQAQPTPSYSTATLSPSLPATIAAATTTNFVTPPYIDCSKQQVVAIMTGNSWSTAGETTGNTNVLYTLAPSVDGSKMDTNKTVTIASYNRTGTVGQSTYSSTNLSANGIKGWFIIKAVNNSAAGVVTNGSDAFTYSVKLGAP